MFITKYQFVVSVKCFGVKERFRLKELIDLWMVEHVITTFSSTSDRTGSVETE